ncbi:DUF4393 domain-containing protein [Aliivibrio fischeri]|uniref:Abi-alpha family protein n=1 Tax=Aliivibrio fischeri TaxID=668 RepID=UPI0012D8ACA7|nr:Abi-alpha family protein [Aliivibrio fischeri]MUK61500.1 DUF4393 domain-containing protein [Aliivibrio fischeri]MUL22229.1 DUF4393 domain-containing protein [Aliivibrio fischeri]MUL25556.1 DUF4393 domain-containing protein [Aliivibrio fischeri]
MSNNDEISIGSEGIRLKGEIVEDLRKPMRRAASTADSILRLFDNVIGLPVDAISSFLEPFREQYKEGYKKIPHNRRIEPSFRIGCSILKNVAYSAEEPEIQRLFAQLLISSSDSDLADKVHPGYASVINELTTLDAKVLKGFISKNENTYAIDEAAYVQRSLSNLLRLGLLTWKQRDHNQKELERFVGKRHYSAPKRIEDTNRVVVDLINDVQKLKNNIIQDNVAFNKRQELSLTSFGQDFLSVALNSTV